MNEEIEILTELWIEAKHQQGRTKNGCKDFKERCIDLHAHLNYSVQNVNQSYWVQGRNYYNDRF